MKNMCSFRTRCGGVGKVAGYPDTAARSAKKRWRRAEGKGGKWRRKRRKWKKGKGGSPTLAPRTTGKVCSLFFINLDFWANSCALMPKKRWACQDIGRGGCDCRLQTRGHQPLRRRKLRWRGDWAETTPRPSVIGLDSESRAKAGVEVWNRK